MAVWEINAAAASTAVGGALWIGPEQPMAGWVR